VTCLLPSRAVVHRRESFALWPPITRLMSIEEVEYKNGATGRFAPSSTRCKREPMPTTPAAPDPESTQQIEQSLASVRQALAGLRYGHVGLTVHEGRVVQIDVTEKRRFTNN